MSTTVLLGIPGVDLRSGDHVCAFYRGTEERDDILLPFAREGLNSGDKCICVVESVETSQVRQSLGYNANGAAHPALEVLTPEESYLRPGHFSMTAMLEFWEHGVEQALGDGGFSFVRVVGEMPSAVEAEPDLEEFFTYESELNRFAPRFPVLLLCLYDLDRFSGTLLIDILRTHPVMLLGGVVMDNPYYLEPDEFLATRSDARS
jgi:hypothetical protein